MSLLKATVIALVVATLTGCVGDPPSAAPSTESPATSATPVVLDYSPTHSDIGALLYLASRPDVDLLAVTLPGTGEADCVPGTRNTRQLLALERAAGEREPYRSAARLIHLSATAV